MRGEAYNVCRGEGTRVAAILESLISKSRVPIEVVSDSALGSSADAPVQVGNAGRLVSLTGWTPMIPLDQSLADLLAWWRQRL
jgi:GDP-4-dehydro-6-deoxy-D-mannose reductase